MKEKLKFLLRKPIVLTLLAAELIVVVFGCVQAARPAVSYEITPDQWEVIAENTAIDYDEAGRLGAVEMAEEESILRTPQMKLPAGHYRVTADYSCTPARDEDGRVYPSGVYFMADDALVVTGEKELFALGQEQDTVVLNVRYTNKTIRLVAFNGGGSFTIGRVVIRQDMLYAWTRVAGWLLTALLIDALLLVFLPVSPLAIQDADLRGCLFLLGCAVLLVCMPLMVSGGGIFGDDINFHLSRIDGIAQGLQKGQFPVRIYSQAKDGYGYAPSLFYGELLLYFPAVLRLLGVSVQLAYQLYAAAVQVLTAGIAFFSFRQIFRHNKTALLGSILYLLNPYRMQNLYWRAAVGEYTAMAFLPLIPAALCLLYGQEEPTKKQAHTACVELVIAFGMLLQCHMISLEIAVLATAFFCVCHLRRTFSRRVIGTWLGAVVAVLLLNLWFLLPFLQVLASGQYGGMYGGTTMNAGRTIQRYGYSIPELFTWHTFSKNIGIELLIGSGIFLWTWIGSREALPRREQKLGLWSVGVGLAACWAGTSTFPWGLVGALPGKISGILLAIQFPWRYLALAAVLLPIGTLCAVSVLRARGWGRQAAVLLLSVSLFGVGIFYREFLPYQTQTYMGDSGELIYADSSVSNMAWYYDPLYLPIGAKEDRDGFVTEAEGTAAAEKTWEKTTGGMIVDYTAEGEQQIELPLLYYPVYAVQEGIGTLFKTESGMLGVTVPAGSGTLHVVYREPLPWRAAEGVSLLALIGLVGFCLKKKKRGA